MAKYNPRNRHDTPVGKWLQAVDFRNNRSWILTPDGVMKTKLGNKWYTAREFDKKYPSKPPVHFYGNPENPDKRKSFIY